MASISCFFCQNLLSDFIEGILPSARYDELEHHLESCPTCSKVHHDLVSTLDFLHSIPSHALPQEMTLKITEASQASGRFMPSRANLSRAVLTFAVPVLLLTAALLAFPKAFPWLARLGDAPREESFVRYYPLLNGAADIVEEQAGWLHLREPFMRSVWEEGGLSPEEFEKSFQWKGVKPDERAGEGQEEL